MPPKEGALWEFFFKGPKQNASINEAYSLGCIRHHQCVKDPPNNTDLVLKDRLKWEEAAFTAAHEESGYVRGEKSAMIAHLIGRKPCHEAAGTGGTNIPFSSAEIERVRNQFLRATISANLPFRWTEDIEIIKLFIMSDGWKDDSKNPITGVNISANGKTEKDGASMCLAFESMIDKAEQDYGCIVMVFVCNNDGGSQMRP
ncbi:hypothetical protein C8J57DRAFT_1249061 [Mycena rebaudengoi]|nr:hypothetical protein C8J57DRAFT_1249061 [Mycena rebaudengoi]